METFRRRELAVWAVEILNFQMRSLFGPLQSYVLIDAVLYVS